MQSFPKVLVLSNECFSDSSSNGRTLRNFFVGWPGENLAQFYIHGSAPDREICHRYYCVSDGAALRAFLKGKPACGMQTMLQEQTPQSVPQNRKIPRDAISMLLRDFVWSSMRWAGTAFFEWVEEFSPELILLQAGDSAFMLRLARNLAQKYSIPLILYNSEAYYFKEFDYFQAKGLAKVAYPLFRRSFCKEFEKTIRVAAFSIYCCDKLKRDYDSCFGLPSQVVYTSTQQRPAEKIESNKPLRISYLGNLGLERHTGLVEIGNALQELSMELKLDVYGKLPNAEAEQAFAQCRGICYHGFVSYKKVQEIISASDILIHTESFGAFYREDLKYAFSTKIADSLASGRCFLIYAPKELACTEYLAEHQAAWIVDRQEALLPVLKKLVQDPSERSKFIARAAQLAEENHNMEKNVSTFQSVLQKYTEETR